MTKANTYFRFSTFFMSLLLFFWILFIVPTASAEEIAVELFDYDLGELAGQADGTGWASHWISNTGLTEMVDTTGFRLTYDIPGGETVSDNGTALELIGNSNTVAYRELALLQDGDQVLISFLVRFQGTVEDNDFLGIWFDNTAGGDHTGAPNIGIKSNQGDGSGPLDFFARTLSNQEAYAVDLVPDETVLNMVKERVGCLRCGGGFLLDGFPRTVAQAEALEHLLDQEKLSLDAVLSYELPLDKIVSRLSGRRTCSGCKAVDVPNRY